MNAVTYKSFKELNNPAQIEITMSDDSQYIIKKGRKAKAYQAWLALLDQGNHEILNHLISTQLGSVSIHTV